MQIGGTDRRIANILTLHFHGWDFNVHIDSIHVIKNKCDKLAYTSAEYQSKHIY